MPGFEMTAQELTKTNIQVNEANKKLGLRSADQKAGLGKDSFLKLLITQLSHQDPTRPMEDKEFISQMAQFSSLEQITNMNRDFQTLIKSSQSSEASSLLGKLIDAYDVATQTRISGKVTAIVFSEGEIKVRVGDKEVAMKDIHAVFQDQENTEPKKNN
jgi:flagellar basal-body rod modification protein FlgD